MKKSILLLFAAFATLVASAQTKVEIDGIWYKITSEADKQAEVTFKGISYYSYHDEYSGSITIPATVTHNGVAYSVTSIGDYAFYQCPSLKSITIPKGVTRIGVYAFYECSSLTAINIPEGVTIIGGNAFYYCSSLTAITIPEGVTSIGDYAFEGCFTLTAINIPESVTSIEQSAFYNCSGLTAIIVEEGNEVYDSRNGCNAIIETNSNTLIQGCSTTIIPESVTSIGNYAFQGCSSLTAITIPESVTRIGEGAFQGCSSLTTITLSEGVTRIEYLAFSGCSSLTSITCEAIRPPTVHYSKTFYYVNESIPVYVPAGSVEAYKVAEGWSVFTNIVSMSVPITHITLSQSSATLLVEESLTLTATVAPENATDKTLTWSSSNPSVATVDNMGKVTAIASGTATITATANDGSGVSAQCEVTIRMRTCATPTISYEDGKISLTCDTEDATIRSSVRDNNIGDYEVTEYNVIPTYTITAYATKEQYEDSDIATLILCWVPCDGNHEGGTTGILTIPAKPVLIQCQGGVITLSGLDEGTEVAVFTTGSIAVATATATDGTATLTTGLEAGTIAIVKIGDYSIKVAIK